jgi:hypothetical protein
MIAGFPFCLFLSLYLSLSISLFLTHIPVLLWTKCTKMYPPSSISCISFQIKKNTSPSDIIGLQRHVVVASMLHTADSVTTHLFFSDWTGNFLHTSAPKSALQPTQPLIKWARGLSSRSVKHTTNSHTMLRLRMSGDTHPISICPHGLALGAAYPYIPERLIISLQNWLLVSSAVLSIVRNYLRTSWPVCMSSNNSLTMTLPFSDYNLKNIMFCNPLPLIWTVDIPYRHYVQWTLRRNSLFA